MYSVRKPKIKMVIDGLQKVAMCKVCLCGRVSVCLFVLCIPTSCILHLGTKSTYKPQTKALSANTSTKPQMKDISGIDLEVDQ